MSNIQGLRPGATLRHGTYRIERMLGQGGFGITYLATDLNLERLVAIKEFFPKDYCDREATTSHVTLGTQGSSEFVNRLKAKFLKEARNIAKFDHPGIIKIHAAFEENNTAYYVMDYIEGGSLSEMVKRHGPLPEAKSVEYIEKVGEALEYIHAHKINHLDIKPANIMVRRSDDNPILIDFGLSKQYDSSGLQTSTTPTGISHGYAPMEQYNDGGVKEFSPQTDLYSLAATLYYMLSGVTPPQATKLIEDELTFPDSIPTAFISPISKAMSPSRKSRHESVRKFLCVIRGVMMREESTEIVEKPKPKAAPKPKQTPKATSAPTPDSQHNNESPFGQEPDTKSKRGLYIGIGIVAAIVIAFVIIVASGGKGNGGKATSEDADSIAMGVVEAIETPKVTDMYWKSTLGGMSYTGEVMIDTVSGKRMPHGKGVGEITDGQYKGNIYDGEFVNGNMEGQATYTVSNGDTFEGTFKNNKYYQGRYTIKESGEYFEGSFKNGEPDESNGNWYNKKEEKMSNTKEVTVEVVTKSKKAANTSNPKDKKTTKEAKSDKSITGKKENKEDPALEFKKVDYNIEEKMNSPY